MTAVITGPSAVLAWRRGERGKGKIKGGDLFQVGGLALKKKPSKKWRLLRQSFPFLVVIPLVTGCGWKPGDIGITGSASHAFNRGEIIAPLGIEILDSGEPSEKKDIFYILVFHPVNVPVIGHASNHRINRRKSIETITWSIQRYPPHDYQTVDKRTFSYEFEKKKKRILIGEQGFDLSVGNVLLVKMNPSWVPSVEQVPIKVEGFQNFEGVVEKLKNKFSKDEMIQRIKLK